MTARRAHGLFHKAIVQSGGGWLPATPLKTAHRAGRSGGDRAGPDQPRRPTPLRALAPEHLTAIEGAFGPVIDGRLLDRDPISAFARGDFADVPLMIGVNSGEDSLLNYGGGLKRFGQLIKPNAKLAALYPHGERRRGTTDPPGLPRLRLRRPGALGGVGVRASRKPGSTPFDYVEEAARRATMPRASHAAEIFHVFETLDHRPDGAPPATEADRAISAAMHARPVVAFARSGVARAPDWPAYVLADDAWMVFNDTPGGEVKRGWCEGGAGPPRAQGEAADPAAAGA